MGDGSIKREGSASEDGSSDATPVDLVERLGAASKTALEPPGAPGPPVEQPLHSMETIAIRSRRLLGARCIVIEHLIQDTFTG